MTECDYLACNEEAEYVRRKHKQMPKDRKFCQKHIKEFWQLVETPYRVGLLFLALVIVGCSKLKNMVFNAPKIFKQKIKGDIPLRYVLIEGEVEELNE